MISYAISVLSHYRSVFMKKILHIITTQFYKEMLSRVAEWLNVLWAVCRSTHFEHHQRSLAFLTLVLVVFLNSFCPHHN
jgi:hypothetical protein